MKLDPTVTLGNILTALLLVGALFGHAVYLAGRLTSLEVKMDALWTQFLRSQGPF